MVEPDIVIRPTEPGERRAVSGVISTALLQSPPDDARWEKIEARDDPSISLSAWDGDRCVGHAGHFLVETAVPGGSLVPTGAVARVGVLPTHRRRGVASGLMRAVVADAAERDLTLLSLRASEAPIYGRFGFGMAADLVRVEIAAGRARPLTCPEIGGRFEILAGPEVLATVKAVQSRAIGRRAGEITRPDLFWLRLFDGAIEGRDGWFVAAHYPDGADEADGFVQYRIGWDDTLPDIGGIGDVGDLIAVDDAVELALWRYLLDIDLIRTWRSRSRPVDDLVVESMADRRAYRIVGHEDEQWVRLVDVDRALAARSWNPVAADRAVRLAVVDELIPANTGCWRIGPGGPERLDDGPGDLRVDVGALGAAYLGGTSWRSLAAAGRVEERTPGAVARADLLFAVRPHPFCGTSF